MNTPAELPPALLDPLDGRPLVLVDVGARGGPAARWRPLFEHLSWVAFEPDARSREALSSLPDLPRRHLVLAAALSDRSHSAALHLTREEGDSSMLRPNVPFLQRFGKPERFDVIGTNQLQTYRLDDELAAHAVGRVDFLKLDTQGTELHILRGSEQTLAAGVIGIDVEVEFSQMYEAQPLFADVDALLRRFSLQLFDLAPRRWPYATGKGLTRARGPLIWGDALYLRTACAIAEDLRAFEAAEREPHLAKAVIIALTYGFPDFALELLDHARDLIHRDRRLGMEDAVRTWDATSMEPLVPIQIDLQPKQLRALRRLEGALGLKPAAQLKRAVRQWIKDHKSADRRERDDRPL